MSCHRPAEAAAPAEAEAAAPAEAEAAAPAEAEAAEVTEVADALRPPSAEVVAALVDNHREFLAFLERRVGDRAAAEDILQEAFVRGIERAGTVQRQESVTAWFYRSLRNAVVDHFRRAGARARTATAAAAEPPELPDEEAEGAVCRCVARLADTLKPEYALALRKVEVEGQSVQGLAEELGITANNAAVRLFRARQALKRQVMASCGTCATHGCLRCTCETGRCGPAAKAL